MQTSPSGRKLIETFEGLRLLAYLDQVGIPTVGYGHTGPDVHLGMTITPEEADEFLAVDLHHAEQVIYNTVHVHLDQNQFDSLASLIFNIGGGAFAKSTVLKPLNQGRLSRRLQNAFLMWDKHHGGTVNSATCKP